MSSATARSTRLPGPTCTHCPFDTVDINEQATALFHNVASQADRPTDAAWQARQAGHACIQVSPRVTIPCSLANAGCLHALQEVATSHRKQVKARRSYRPSERPRPRPGAVHWPRAPRTDVAAATCLGTHAPRRDTCSRVSTRTSSRLLLLHVQGAVLEHQVIGHVAQRPLLLF